MKKDSSQISRFRVRKGPMASQDEIGLCGMFHVPYGRGIIQIVASDGTGCEWEHVSCLYRYLNQKNKFINRVPTWEEMSFVKALFWEEEETVIQFHPAKSEYVNCHPEVLHLWKKIGIDHELPPHWLVGPKESDAKEA